MLHIKSTIPMLVNIDKDYILEHQSSRIDLNLDKDLILKCYPLQNTYQGKSTLPYTLLIRPGELISCSRYQYTLYPKSHHEITLLPFCIKENNLTLEQTYHIQNSSKDLTIKHGVNTTFCIKNGQETNYYENENLLQYLSSLEYENQTFVLTQCNTNYHLTIIKNNMITYRDFLETCQYKNNTLSAILPIYDMAKHAIAYEIHFAKPYRVNSKIIYQDQKPKLTNIPELIPYAFLEAIKISNYELARFYLAENLKEKLTDNTLKGFFGDFVHISHDIYNDNLCLIYNDANNYIAKNYTFEITNNKISNINEL